MRAKEIRDLNGDALMKLLADKRDDIVNFRLQLATGVVENTRRAREARRDIARIKTILRERELLVAKGTSE